MYRHVQAGGRLHDDRRLFLWAVCLFAFLLVGCHKNAVAPRAQAPPQASVPTASPIANSSDLPAIAQFEAEPTSILRGQSSTLRWDVKGEGVSVSLDQNVGLVQRTGSRQVSPSQSTTYTLTVAGSGGKLTALATVRVSSPPPPPPPTSGRPNGTLTERVASELQDVYFDYGTNTIRGDAGQTLKADAAVLKSILADFPTALLVIEGHCDDRGSAEYNLGLGDRRATSAADVLVRFGVPVDRLRTVSYGKERPQCTETDESCWQRNRRAHFSAGN